MNKQKNMSLAFEQLIASIRQTHEYMAAYPQIRGTLSPKFDLIAPDAIRKSLISELNRLLLGGRDNQLLVSKYEIELPK